MTNGTPKMHGIYFEVINLKPDAKLLLISKVFA